MMKANIPSRCARLRAAEKMKLAGNIRDVCQLEAAPRFSVVSSNENKSYRGGRTRARPAHCPALHELLLL